MLIQVRAHPKSSKNAVIPTPDGYIEVYTSMAPIKNLANQAIVGLLAGYFNVPKSQIKLIRGRTSRYKVFEVLKSE